MINKPTKELALNIIKLGNIRLKYFSWPGLPNACWIFMKCVKYSRIDEYCSLCSMICIIIYSFFSIKLIHLDLLAKIQRTLIQPSEFIHSVLCYGLHLSHIVRQGIGKSNIWRFWINLSSNKYPTTSEMALFIKTILQFSTFSKDSIFDPCSFIHYWMGFRLYLTKYLY